MQTRVYLAHERIDDLIAALRSGGRRCLGPVVRDGAIVFGEITGADQLPWGWHDEQSPGRYRLTRADRARCFAWANGPQALKPLCFAPEETLWSVVRDAGGGLRFEPQVPAPEPLAVIGVRACDLAALELQDRHFLARGREDPHYRARRADWFLVAVNCTHPAETCFCAATGDGPSARTGYDLVLDEVGGGFVVGAGTEAGRAVLDGLDLPPADDARLQQAQQQHAGAVAGQTRRLPARDLPQLYERLDHPRWDEVAARCLACGNCTSVCPTCFCHAEFDEPAIDGAHSAHRRHWDSCFSAAHSYIHGRTLRADTRLRYRQWLTHKLAGWVEQFGRGGCVGCGRCITWCPVGIDLTEEVAALVRDAG